MLSVRPTATGPDGCTVRSSCPSWQHVLWPRSFVFCHLQKAESHLSPLVTPAYTASSQMGTTDGEEREGGRRRGNYNGLREVSQATDFAYPKEISTMLLASTN